MGVRDGWLYNADRLGQTAKFTFGKGFRVVGGKVELDLEPKSALHINQRDKVDFAFNAPFELQGNSPLALGVNLPAPVVSKTTVTNVGVTVGSALIRGINLRSGRRG